MRLLKETKSHYLYASSFIVLHVSHSLTRLACSCQVNAFMKLVDLDSTYKFSYLTLGLGYTSVSRLSLLLVEKLVNAGITFKYL